jgi:Uma2 family endonuclease
MKNPEHAMNTPFPVRADGKFTVEEYLAFIASRPEEERWQLIDGVAMMMPPPTRRHQRIASNLARLLNDRFEKVRPDLYAYQEVGVMVPDVENFRPEADVAVLDSSGDSDETLYAERFYLIAEVLSDSNTDKDIATKSHRYLQHPLNLYFLLFDQKEVRVEVRARAAEWAPVILKGLDAVLELPEWGFSALLAALCRGTSLEGPAPP